MHEGNHAIPCSLLVYLNWASFFFLMAKFHQKVNFKIQKLSDFAHFQLPKVREKKTFYKLQKVILIFGNVFSLKKVPSKFEKQF